MILLVFIGCLSQVFQYIFVTGFARFAFFPVRPVGLRMSISRAKAIYAASLEEKPTQARAQTSGSVQGGLGGGHRS